QMPVMDGCEATRQIRSMEREDAKKIPIYAVSANAFAEDVKNAMDSGMNGHIAKPVDWESIDKVLNQYLR
ncbi:MAG: response regulator, partial [Lachnospiraceae bacterium]|nr:response regulator [Lachnospiraceae bacterium]